MLHHVEFVSIVCVCKLNVAYYLRIIDWILTCAIPIFIGVLFFFKQKTAYEVRISDWSSDVCSSDLISRPVGERRIPDGREIEEIAAVERDPVAVITVAHPEFGRRDQAAAFGKGTAFRAHEAKIDAVGEPRIGTPYGFDHFDFAHIVGVAAHERSEESSVGKGGVSTVM